MDQISVVKGICFVISAFCIASCLFLKVPQIMEIRKRKSNEGVCLAAMLLEIVSFSIMILYNYLNSYGPMTYLEYPIILVQVYVMLVLTLYYKGQLGHPLTLFFIGLYTLLVCGFLAGVLPTTLLSKAVVFCCPMSGMAKVTYIWGIIRIRNADSVALPTWYISIASNLLRLFTVYMDNGDVKLMGNFGVSAFLSLSVLGTAMYYQQCVSCTEECLDRRRRFSQQKERRVLRRHLD